jgi:uncharacterized protein involved in outer membrane biogenesis
MALLILLIIGAVNLPFVHTFLTKKTNTILAEKGIPIHVGKLTLLINGKIGLKQLEIISNNSDTIIYAGKASVDVRPLPLLKKRVVVRNINLENVVANIIFDEQTGELNIISLISKNESDETIVLKDTTTTTQAGVNWEIQVGDIELKNIRFIYSDTQSGILVEQNLEKAKIKFDYFSLLNEQIDVENIEITKPEGMVAIWETTNISEEETDSETTWKFSLKNLEISNLLFELDQPDAGQRMKFSLKKGQVSLEKLDLATQEILVEKIKLNKPLVTILTSEQNSTPANIDEESTDFSLPKIPWIIQLKKQKLRMAFSQPVPLITSLMLQWINGCLLTD